MSLIKKISFTPKKNTQTELLLALSNLTKESKKEDGCLFYYFFKHKEKYIILESWKNSKYLDAHKKTKHFLQFKEKSLDCIHLKDTEIWEEMKL